jgi:hypothetical protein
MSSPVKDKAEKTRIKNEFEEIILDGEKELFGLYDSDDEMKDSLAERMVFIIFCLKRLILYLEK